MTTPSERLLLSLRDFIGDALSETDISAQDIVTAIRDELTELQDYHRIQNGKIEQLLDMIEETDDLPEFHNYLSNSKLDEIDIADDLDRAIQHYKGNQPKGNLWDNLSKKDKKRFRKLGE